MNIIKNKVVMLFGVLFMPFQHSIGMVIENEYFNFSNRISKASTQEELDAIYKEVYASNEDSDSLTQLFSAIKIKKYWFELQDIEKVLESEKVDDDDITYYFVRLNNIGKGTGKVFADEISLLLNIVNIFAEERGIKENLKML